MEIGDRGAFAGAIGTAEATRMGRARGSGMAGFTAAVLVVALFLGFAAFASFFAAGFAVFSLSSGFAAVTLAAGFALSSGLAYAGAANAIAVAIAHPTIRR